MLNNNIIKCIFDSICLLFYAFHMLYIYISTDYILVFDPLPFGIPLHWLLEILWFFFNHA